MLYVVLSVASIFGEPNIYGIFISCDKAEECKKGLEQTYSKGIFIIKPIESDFDVLPQHIHPYDSKSK
jgi:hypothetical protein